MPDDRPDRTKDLRKALHILRAALEAAPNPHVSDGPPALWTWYDGARATALAETKDV